MCARKKTSCNKSSASRSFRTLLAIKRFRVPPNSSHSSAVSSTTSTFSGASTPDPADFEPLDACNLTPIGTELLGRVSEHLADGHAVEGVEAPLASLLFPDQPRVLEPPHMVGNLGLPYKEAVLELAHADAPAPLSRRHAEVRKAAAAAPRGGGLGHHTDHAHPYGVRERPAERYEPLHPLRPVFVFGDAAVVALDDCYSPFRHHLPSAPRLASPDEGARSRNLAQRLAPLRRVQALYRLRLVDVLDLHRDTLEARSGEQRLVLLLLQGPDHAPGPQPYRLKHLVGQIGLAPKEDHVGDSEAAPGLEDPIRLGDHPVLVGGEIYDAVAHHDVHVPVRQRHVLDLALEELGILHPGLRAVPTSELKHLVGHVQAISLPARSHASRREQNIDSAAASEVQYHLTRRERRQGHGITAPQRGPYRLLGQLTPLLVRIAPTPKVHNYR